MGEHIDEICDELDDLINTHGEGVLAKYFSKNDIQYFKRREYKRGVGVDGYIASIKLENNEMYDLFKYPRRPIVYDQR